MVGLKWKETCLACVGMAVALFFSAQLALAAPVKAPKPDADYRMSELIKRELAKQFPGARVEITSAVQWVRGELPADLLSVSLLNTTNQGEARFMVKGQTAAEVPATMDAEGRVLFSAWVPALVAVRRVHPGERLMNDMFVVQDVNVAQGMPYEYRGVILPGGTDLFKVAKLEARQTIMEGQFALTNGVQRVPDVRRGDSIKIKLVSDSLSLMTAGQADEPGYLDGQLRVITHKTKRQLLGTLCADGVVEVKI